MGKADQIQPDPYAVNPRTLIFATHGDRVLLLKGSERKKAWANLYNGLGGKVEMGEDILTSARREFVEETGLQPDDLWLCGVVIIDFEISPGKAIFIFRTTCANDVLQHTTEGVAEWVDREDLTNLPMVEDLPVILPRILAMEPGAPVFFARYSFDEQDRLQIQFAG